MSEPASMRDRVESGKGMLYSFGFAAAVSWLWHGHTSAFSLWWATSLVLVIASMIGFGRGLRLILSGFSGFGRNFYEERDLPGEPSEDSSDDQSVALNTETAGALALPLVLLISGGIMVLFKVFPAMNYVPEFPGVHWVSPRFLAVGMFIVGLVVVAWSVLLRVMMKTGPDRWTYLPGTRGEIRRVTRSYIVVSVILIAIATGYMINS